MLIFAGSYERFIFGYSANADCSEPQDIVKKYTFAAHKSAVKCIAAAGPYVASGGADDQIHLLDMKGERDLGTLLNPGDGAVPCLEFFVPEGHSAPSHMFSGSADGSISVWSAGSWEHLKSMKGHKGGVNSFAVHGSGRIGLSVARDCFLRMWALAKGVCTYTQRMEAEAELVAFTPSGDSFVLLANGQALVQSAGGEASGPVARYTPARRALCLAQQHDDVLLLGLEDGSLRLWDVRSGREVAALERAHASRVRALAKLREGAGKVPEAVASCSSDGSLKLWDLRMMGGSQQGQPASCSGQAETRARLTCLTAIDPAAPPRPKAAAPVAGPDASASAAKGAASQPQGKHQKQQPQQQAVAAKEGHKDALRKKQQQQKQQQASKTTKVGNQQQQRQQKGKAQHRGSGGGLDFEIVPAERSDDDDAGHDEHAMARFDDDSGDEAPAQRPAKGGNRAGKGPKGRHGQQPHQAKHQRQDQGQRQQGQRKRPVGDPEAPSGSGRGRGDAEDGGEPRGVSAGGHRPAKRAKRSLDDGASPGPAVAVRGGGAAGKGPQAKKGQKQQLKQRKHSPGGPGSSGFKGEKKSGAAGGGRKAGRGSGGKQNMRQR